MKIALYIPLLALCISGCQYEIIDFHFGPNPGDGIEVDLKEKEIHFEKSHPAKKGQQS